MRNHGREFRQFMKKVAVKPYREMPNIKAEVMDPAMWGEGRTVEEVGSHWDRATQEYEKLFHQHDQRAQFADHVHDMLSHVEFRKDDKILEIGTDFGYLPAFLAKRMPKGKVICLDASSEMVKKALKVKEKAKVSNLEVQQVFGTRLNIPDESQNKVIIHATAGSHEIMMQILSEARRVLRKDPNSRLVQWYSGFPSDKQFGEMRLTQSGFRIVKNLKVAEHQGQMRWMIIGAPA